MNQLLQETKSILKKYGIYAHKNLGQNFLIQEEVVQQIIEGAQIGKEDLVIEIGPGLGTLTKELIKKSGKVVAIELDKRMISILTDRFHEFENFTLIHEDILKVDLKECIKTYQGKLKMVKIVANLPYYITTPIIMKLLEDNLPIETITVMVQKEVADRLIEKPGGKNSGAITYSVYYYADAMEIAKVMPNAFLPEPAVESKVIQLILQKEKRVQVENEQVMFQIIHGAFMHRRKTLVNALKKCEIFHSNISLPEILKKLGLNEQIRGEALSLEDYANITNLVTKM